MEYLKIATLVILFIASLFLLYWVFRPGSKKRYDNYSNIPFQDEQNNSLSKSLESENKNGGE